MTLQAAVFFKGRLSVDRDRERLNLNGALSLRVGIPILHNGPGSFRPDMLMASNTAKEASVTLQENPGDKGPYDFRVSVGERGDVSECGKKVGDIVT